MNIKTNDMKVISKIFGTGTILTQDENNVTVDFNGTVKTMIIRFAKLTNEDGTAFGVQAQKVAKTKKTVKSRRVVTNQFENADGTINMQAFNDFTEERRLASHNTISW